MSKNKKQVSKTNMIIIGLIIIGVVLLGLFKLGIVGRYLDYTVRYLFGEYHHFIYLLTIIFAFYVMYDFSKFKKIKTKHYLGFIFILVGFLLITTAIFSDGLIKREILNNYLANSNKIFTNELNASGGLIGVFLFTIFTSLFDFWGSNIVATLLILIGLILVVNFNYINNKINSLKLKNIERKENKAQKVSKKSVVSKDVIIKQPPVDDSSKKSPFITLKNQEKQKVEQIELNLNVSKDYQMPSLDLLDTSIKHQVSKKNEAFAKIKGQKLVEVLDDFNISVELVDTHIGPAVTKFEIRPEPSVKISKISSMLDNIKMELAAKSIRIEAPIPGKNTVGIEIENAENTFVRMYEVLSDLPTEVVKKPLVFALGKDLMGNVVYCDLEKMPHLLIAGATGAGKSMAINAMITTLLLKTSPDDVRLLLIDPKKVEFTHFANIPHLITDVVVDANKANIALLKVIEIMDERYELFAEVGVKNITAYNDLRNRTKDEQLKHLEYIVVIIDELADLMIVASRDVEASIQRITQLARAAGIHLIVATQRPSTDVITGIIKANIPSRISFAVSSGIDSRTILDTVGAEKLLGNGDMLYYPVTMLAPVRLQGVFVDDSEIVKVTNFVSKNKNFKHFDSFENLEEALEISNDKGLSDPLYEEVKSFVIDTQKASASLIQRHFSIGFNRAARLVDTLESEDIVGPQRGSKPREVLVSK